MTRRNDVRSQVNHALVLRRLGYCLTGVGVMSSSLAYTQTIANAQTSTSNPSADTSKSQRKVQLLPAPKAAVTPPEIIIHPEIKPQPPAAPALQVPAATIQAPAPKPVAVVAPKEIAPPPVAAKPAPKPVAQAPAPAAPQIDSRSAADLLPPSAAKPNRQQPVANVYEPPAEVVITERKPAAQQPVAKTTGKVATTPEVTSKTATQAKQPATKTAEKVAAKADKQTAAATKPNTPLPPAIKPATPKTIAKQAQPKLPLPVVKANVNAQRVMTKPRSAPIRVGPVRLSNAGISFNQTTVNPYFNNTNAKLQAPIAPGLQQLNMMFPIAVPAPITSLFGWRVHPITKAQRLHTGTDIGAAMGTPVMAAMGGRVILADRMGGYGISVAIEHDNGIRQTLYAHMSEIFVRPGDIVQQGTVIGRVGSTGASTGPHLHFELRQMLPDGTWVAQDASQHLQTSMARLVQSLQIAQQKVRAVAAKSLTSAAKKAAN